MQNNQQSAEIFYNTVLPLVLVEPDPENPRKLAIRLQDIRDGFSRNDPLFTQKEAELQKLREVAGTITRSGILNPIIVYKHADKYRIVAGERRFLATFISGAKEIEVRVYQQKPNGFDLKLAQWVENTAREDLSLMERLDNVRDMITEYAKQYPETKVTATWLKDKTSLSLPQATYYINVLRAPDNVIAAIKRGDINSLDKAAIITSSPDAELRAKAISACKAGMSLKNLREMLNSFKQQPDKANAGSSNAISLGSTLNCKVIETIVRDNESTRISGFCSRFY
jgi:ParB family chromosome partitioning protein